MYAGTLKTGYWFVIMLSIVIPVYNEAGSLRQLVREIRDVLTRIPGEHEVVFVDDGSTDASWAILSEFAENDQKITAVRLRKNSGKAIAYAAGFRESRGDIIATLDADLQDDPAEIPRLLARLEGSGGVPCDVVVGWKERRQDPVIKVWSSRVYNALLRRVSGTCLHDQNSGMRVLRREVIAAIPLRGDLYRMIPALAAMSGFRIAEVSVHHRPRLHGASKYGKTGLRRMLRGLFDLMTIAFLFRFRARPFHFFGAIGGVLLSLGVVVNAYLTILRLSGERISGRPLLLFGILLMVIGVQFISTGFLADLIITGRERSDELPIAEVRRNAQVL